MGFSGFSLDKLFMLTNGVYPHPRKRGFKRRLRRLDDPQHPGRCPDPPSPPGGSRGLANPANPLSQSVRHSRSVKAGPLRGSLREALTLPPRRCQRSFCGFKRHEMQIGQAKRVRPGGQKSARDPVDNLGCKSVRTCARLSTGTRMDPGAGSAELGVVARSAYNPRSEYLASK